MGQLHRFQCRLGHIRLVNNLIITQIHIHLRRDLTDLGLVAYQNGICNALLLGLPYCAQHRLVLSGRHSHLFHTALVYFVDDIIESHVRFLSCGLSSGSGIFHAAPTATAFSFCFLRGESAILHDRISIARDSAFIAIVKIITQRIVKCNTGFSAKKEKKSRHSSSMISSNLFTLAYKSLSSSGSASVWSGTITTRQPARQALSTPLGESSTARQSQGRLSNCSQA